MLFIVVTIRKLQGLDGQQNSNSWDDNKISSYIPGKCYEYEILIPEKDLQISLPI